MSFVVHVHLCFSKNNTFMVEQNCKQITCTTNNYESKYDNLQHNIRQSVITKIKI